MSAPKTAVFLDLDGTFWNREEVPDSAWQAIEQARANGHRIYVNTGRKIDTIPQFLWDANLDGYCLASGMDLYDGKGCNLERHFMDEGKVRALVTNLIARQVGFSLEEFDREYDDGKYARKRTYYLGQDGRKEFMNRHPLSQMPAGSWSELVKVGFDGEVPFDIDAMARPLGFDVLIYLNHHNPLNSNFPGFKGELTDARWTKASAMRSILAADGLDPKEWRIAAIGDSENDIPMLEAADIGIAMGNGTQAAKAAADFVCPGIDEDGLAAAFAFLKITDKSEAD